MEQTVLLPRTTMPWPVVPEKLTVPVIVLLLTVWDPDVTWMLALLLFENVFPLIVWPLPPTLMPPLLAPVPLLEMVLLLTVVESPRRLMAAITLLAIRLPAPTAAPPIST